jgi:hypothetical protein
VDLLIERPGGVAIVEIKSAAAVAPSFFDGLAYYRTLAKTARLHVDAFLVYGGSREHEHAAGLALPWNRLDRIAAAGEK